jgi:hypothetical protein
MKVLRACRQTQARRHPSGIFGTFTEQAGNMTKLHALFAMVWDAHEWIACAWQVQISRVPAAAAVIKAYPTNRESEMGQDTQAYKAGAAIKHR